VRLRRPGRSARESAAPPAGRRRPLSAARDGSCAPVRELEFSFQLLQLLTQRRPDDMIPRHRAPEMQLLSKHDEIARSWRSSTPYHPHSLHNSALAYSSRAPRRTKCNTSARHRNPAPLSRRQMAAHRVGRFRGGGAVVAADMAISPLWPDTRLRCQHLKTTATTPAWTHASTSP
jgi:hypothetical protein